MSDRAWTTIVETFHYALLGTGTAFPGSLLYSAGFAMVVLLIGNFISNRVETTFMDKV